MAHSFLILIGFSAISFICSIHGIRGQSLTTPPQWQVSVARVSYRAHLFHIHDTLRTRSQISAITSDKPWLGLPLKSFKHYHMVRHTQSYYFDPNSPRCAENKYPSNKANLALALVFYDLLNGNSTVAESRVDEVLSDHDKDLVGASTFR